MSPEDRAAAVCVILKAVGPGGHKNCRECARVVGQIRAALGEAARRLEAKGMSEAAREVAP